MVQINRKEKEEIRIVKIVCLIHINRAGIVRIEACEDTLLGIQLNLNLDMYLWSRKLMR